MLPTTLYCVFLNVSDGCSYGFETLFGIFETQDKAETALLEHVEEMARIALLRKENNKQIEKARADKNWNEIRRLGLAWGTFADENELLYVPYETSLDDYGIRPVPSSKIPATGL